MRPLRLLLAGTLVPALALTGGPAPAQAAGRPAPPRTAGAPAATVEAATVESAVRVAVVDRPQRPGTRSVTGPGTGAGTGTGAGAGTGTDSGTGGTVGLVDVDGRLAGLPPAVPVPGPGLRVRVTVTREGGRPAVRAVEALPGQVTARAVPLPVTGRHALTVLPVYWSVPDSSTRASLTALARSVARYWSAQSGGRLTIVPAVRDWVRVADPRSCDPAVLADTALAAHRVALPTSPLDHVVVYFPQRSDCDGWAGMGQIAGPLSWVNGVPLVDVLAHEFGHNLGLGHADAQTCTQGTARVTLSATCSLQPYGDHADVMGAALERPTGNLNAALADWLGLATVTTVPAGGRATVDLVPPGRGPGTRAVRVRTRGGWLYAEYRPAVAPDTRVPGWAGVQLRLLPDGDRPATRLLDGQPASSPLTAVSLPPGRPWTVPGSGLALTVGTVGAAGARVAVAPVLPGAATPAPVITAPAAGSTVAGTVTLNWRPASAASVQVLVDGVPRDPVRAAGSAVVAGLPHGAHLLAVRPAGAAGTASAPVPVTVDAVRPAAPGALGLTPAGLLSWRAVVDAGSGTAGYLVALDGGTPVRTGPAPSARVRTPDGRHTWWVAAVDAVGNVSAASGLVVVRTAATRRRPATLRVSGPVPAATAPRTLTAARTIDGSRAL